MTIFGFLSMVLGALAFIAGIVVVIVFIVKKMSLKIPLIIISASLAIFIMGAVIMALSPPVAEIAEPAFLQSSEPDKPGGSGEPNKDGGSGDPDDFEINFISLNETTSFAEWDYKVIGVEIHKTLRDYRARGQYVVFLLEVKNNAKVDRQVGRLFQVEDQDSRVFSFDSGASLGYHHAFRTDAWHLEDIGPSFSAVVPIAFDVAEDVKTLFLYPADIRDEEFTETSVVAVDLGDI